MVLKSKISCVLKGLNKCAGDIVRIACLVSLVSATRFAKSSFALEGCAYILDQ